MLLTTNVIKAKKNKAQRNRNNIFVMKMSQTIPLGSVPVSIDWCIISSNWNVFEPGAAHTKQK